LIRLTIAIALIVVALTPPAHADKAKARALTDRAMKQYNLGEYATAAEAFKAAYDEYPEPTLLYNLAQCERQLAHKPRAITLYRSYLREVPEAPNADEVRRLIASLEQDVAGEEQARKQTAEHASPAIALPTPMPTQMATPIAPPPRPWWRNPAGWGLVGAGVVVAAVGAGLLGAAQVDQNNAPHAATLADARSQLDLAGALRPAGFALVGVGAASLVAGIVVLAIMPSRWKTRAAIVPSATGAALVIGRSL
jgi:tetratricopeptide (TPR) repeat protein